MKTKFLSKCNKIKVVLTDVDGVLTDGGMYYSDNGDIMKKFHTRDGMGIALLRKNNIPTIIITKEKTKIVKQWSKKMNIAKLYDGILKKELLLDKICEKYHIHSSEVAYIGDDINDVEIMKQVGFSAAPNDCNESVKKIADYVCNVNGGSGVLREVADLILSVKTFN